MASTLERLDSIRDSLINQGIGTSGLTSQAIQRANLPELNDSLNQSRMIRENQSRQQIMGLQKQIKPQVGIQGVGRARGLAENSPTAVVLGNNKGEFGLNLSGTGSEGVRTVRGGLADILKEIKLFQERGGQVVSEESLPDVDQNSFQELLKAGVTPVQKRMAEEMLLGRRRFSPTDAMKIAGSPGKSKSQMPKEVKLPTVEEIQNELLAQGKGRSRDFVKNRLQQLIDMKAL